MPGPGRTKPKKKSKAKAGQPRIPALLINASVLAYVDQIEKAVGWEAVVYVLCGVFELPGIRLRT
jgi:hypothetical protein